MSAPKFAFLALPPPPLPKKRAGAVTAAPPLFLHPRFRSISAWAESVLPGSPAPLTPAPSAPVYRHISPLTSTFHRPSVPARSHSSCRRQSISSTRSNIPPVSFLDLLDTPTINSTPYTSSPLTIDGKEQKIDLMAFGYTSVFVNLPATTPITPAMYKPQPAPTRLPSSPAKASGGMFKRFQSITQIRGKSSSFKAKAQAKRGKARPSPVVSNYMSVSSKKRTKYAASSPAGSAVAIEKKKRDQYVASLPPTIMQEAQLRQVMEGGSLDHNVKKIMQEQAKREGAVKVQTAQGTRVVEGVSDVWRDGEGGIWRDQEEEWESAHLLGGKVPLGVRANIEEWVSFNDMEKDTDSVLSSPRSSHDSDLHESYAMKVDDSMENLRIVARTPVSDSAPPSPCKKVVLLALPSRPSRVAKHLRKPEFLLDVFPVPTSPRSPYPTSPRTTKSLAGSSARGVIRRERSRSVVRQRRAAPPPLQLVPPSPCLKFAINMEGEDESKREFLSDSFEPTTKPLVSAYGAPAPTPGMKKKGSNLVGLFKRGERK